MKASQTQSEFGIQNRKFEVAPLFHSQDPKGSEQRNEGKFQGNEDPVVDELTYYY